VVVSAVDMCLVVSPAFVWIMACCAMRTKVLEGDVLVVVAT